jgi:hypothetical protein
MRHLYHFPDAGEPAAPPHELCGKRSCGLLAVPQSVYRKVESL